jgi:hypothetical protein
MGAAMNTDELVIPCAGIGAHEPMVAQTVRLPIWRAACRSASDAPLQEDGKSQRVAGFGLRAAKTLCASARARPTFFIGTVRPG